MYLCSRETKRHAEPERAEEPRRRQGKILHWQNIHPLASHEVLDEREYSTYHIALMSIGYVTHSSETHTKYVV
jgi:hypothetical protein